METIVLLNTTEDTSREHSHSHLAHAVVKTGDKYAMTRLRRCNVLALAF